MYPHSDLTCLYGLIQKLAALIEIGEISHNLWHGGVVAALTLEFVRKLRDTWDPAIIDG